MHKKLSVLKEWVPTLHSDFPFLAMLVLLALYSVGWYWGLPSEFDSAVDSTVPYSPLAFVSDYFNPYIAEKYPATHQILLLPFYGIFLVAMKFTGEIQSISSVWPYGFTNPSKVMSSLIIISRVVSTFMAVTIILCLRKFTFKDFDKSSQSVAMILMGGSGVFVYYARVANFDVPYLLWWVLSMVFLSFYVFNNDSPLRHLLISAIFSALSIGTKDQAAGLVLGSGLIILLVGSEAKRTAAIRFKHALIFAMVTLLVYTVVAVLPQPIRWISHVYRWALSSSGITDYVQYENSFHGHLNLLWGIIYRLSNIISPIGIFFSVIGMIILFKSHRSKQAWFILIPIISYYGLILFNIRFVYERFLLPIAFLLVIPTGTGVMSTLRGLQTKNLAIYCVAKYGIILLFGYHLVSGYLSITYVQLFDLKRALSDSITSYAPKGSTILWAGGEVNLPNSVVYQNYRLILPEGKVPWSKSVRHVFASDETNFDYILADTPQLLDQNYAELIQVWRYPNWVINSLRFNILSREYFLYRKRVAHFSLTESEHRRY